MFGRILVLLALSIPTVTAAEFVCRVETVPIEPLPDPPGPAVVPPPLHVVLVVDLSDSISRRGAPNWSEEVRAALGRFIEELNRGRPDDLAPMAEAQLAITVLVVGSGVAELPGPLDVASVEQALEAARARLRPPTYTPIDDAIHRAGGLGGDALLLMTDGWPCNRLGDKRPCFETGVDIRATTTATTLQVAARSFAGGAWLFGDTQRGTNENFANEAGDPVGWDPDAETRAIRLKTAKHRFELIEPWTAPALVRTVWATLRERRGAPALRGPTRDRLDLPVTSAIEGESFADAALVGTAAGWGCSGVLVGKGVVATARHCLPATVVSFEARAESVVRVWHVVDAVVPPDPTVDVALLRLDGAPSVGPALRRVATDSTPPAGPLRAVGYGATNRQGDAGFGTRHVVDLPATGWGCEAGRAERLGCNPSYELVIRSPNRDTCNGDSGGPVYEPYVGGAAVGGLAGEHVCGWRLVALTSRPVADARLACGDGGVYTRVDRLEPWLSDTIKQLEDR